MLTATCAAALWAEAIIKMPTAQIIRLSCLNVFITLPLFIEDWVKLSVMFHPVLSCCTCHSKRVCCNTPAHKSSWRTARLWLSIRNNHDSAGYSESGGKPLALSGIRVCPLSLTVGRSPSGTFSLVRAEISAAWCLGYTNSWPSVSPGQNHLRNA